jgi:hypothetical protein
MALFLTMRTIGDEILGISSSGVATFSLFAMLRNIEDFWAPLLAGKVSGVSHGLVLTFTVALRTSSPPSCLLRGVRNGEPGELTCVKNLQWGDFLTGTWLVGAPQLGLINGGVGGWSPP